MMPQADYRSEVDALGDAAGTLSFWPQVKDDPELGPDEALRVLATWSHLDRFPTENLDPDIVREFNALVTRDASTLVSCFSRLTFIDDWLDEMERLDESWDWITDNDDADQANLVAARLFRTLDQFSLASHASRKLLGDDAPGERRADLDAIAQEVAEGERRIREQPDIFLGAAVVASAQFHQFRDDLLEHDDRLWETTIKHQLLCAALEERDAEPAQGFTQQEIDELFPCAPIIESPLQNERPAEILRLRLRQFYGEHPQRAAAATNGDRSLNEERLQIADLRGSVEGDPAVCVKLIPEIVEGRRNGLMIRVLGEDVGRYVEAVVSFGSAMEPREIRLAFGAGKLCEAEGEALSQTDNLDDRIVLRDRHDSERPVRW